MDDNFMTAVIGPAGTGKTFTAFQAFFLRAMERPAAPPDRHGRRVRYTKLTVVRNTYSDLNSSTIPTAKEALEEVEKMGTVKFREGNEPRATIECPLPDGSYMHFLIDFVAVDRPESLKKLLGRACTYALVDEVSEIPESVILRLVTRAGRYPAKKLGGCEKPKIVMVTNGPSTNHFLYQWTIGKKRDVFDSVAAMQDNCAGIFKLYRCPPALIRPTDPNDWTDAKKWSPNPKAENIANLPGGYMYYYKMLVNTDDEIKAYVEGDWVPWKNGELVFPEFSEEHHVIDADGFRLPATAQIGMSFDFGRRPVCLFWFEDHAGRAIVFDEFMMRDASIDELMTQKVWPAYNDKYNRPFIGWVTGDPAGLAGGQGLGASPYEILKADPYNLPIEPPLLGNRIDPRLDCMHVLLQNMSRGGVPGFGVMSNCRCLIGSLSNTYIYESKRGSTGVRDIPTKSGDNWCSDVADACTYGVQYRAMQTSFKMPTPTKNIRHAGRRRRTYGKW